MTTIKWILIATATFLIVSGPARASDRIALVIGNSDYKSAPLKNPVNDARDFAASLEAVGFDVAVKLNATQRDMERAIRDFGKKLRYGKVGLFYYAGHGIQVKASNYLIPVGAEIESEGDTKYESVDASLVLAKMEDAQNDLNIVILDACRNNPFARSFRSSTSGLARMDAPKGSLIAYSTAPGSVAADGDGRNGIYTKHLLREMKKPGLTIEEVLKNVRVSVVTETVNRQVPWESSSLIGTFYFEPAKPSPDPLQQASPGQPAVNSYEIVFWESIVDSSNADAFRAYLNEYPQGAFAPLATIKIQQLTAGEKVKKSAAKPVGSTAQPNPGDISPALQLNPKPADSASQHPSPDTGNIMLAAIDPKVKEPDIVERDGQYLKYRNGIVYDTKTGLEWLPGPDKKELYSKGLGWASEINTDGGGWRMPSKDELRTLYREKDGVKNNMTHLLETKRWYILSKDSRNTRFKGINFRSSRPFSKSVPPPTPETATTSTMIP